jgi:5-dehydro-2-deoxygluconokinase
MGRTCVDLYSEQQDARLEDVRSFRKYVGGSAANIAVGTARLGMKTAMLARVGDEQLGRYVRRTLEENGVEVSRVISDPERLTPLVLLAVREVEGFPRIFVYNDSADMALGAEDVEPEFIASSKALLVSGTHLSNPRTRAATLAATRTAREAGTRVALDLDYRPVFWGVASHDRGGEMFVASPEVTEAYRPALAGCDLIVGTEEEIRIAGGSTDTRRALLSIRESSAAAIVLKTGALGATLFEGGIPASLDVGLRVPAFPVEVFNSVGAGDAFMSGFLSGWLYNEPPERCLTLGNACGAIVVSRHGCSPAMPTREELEYYLPHAPRLRRLRDDRWLEHLHRATTRNAPDELRVLAVDHRWQLEAMADEAGADRERLRELKRIICRAFRGFAAEDGSSGLLLDDVYGRDALAELTGSGAWIGRAVEVAGSRPVEFAGGPNVAATLRAWPEEHVVKCMVYCHPDDEPALRETQERRVVQLHDACLSGEHRLLLEIQTPQDMKYDDRAVISLLQRFYELGVKPDWWKLPPNPDASVWKGIGSVVRDHDPYCAGILVLGQAMEEEALGESFAAATAEPLCRGFAVGRSIYAEPARRWLAGEMGDVELADEVAGRYRRMSDLWRSGRAGSGV